MTVFTHRRADDTTATLRRLIELAAAAGVTLRFDAEETAKHALQRGPGVALDTPVEADVELCVVLGGDGTILRALGHYAGTGVPVFAINFGEIGFLATAEPRDLDDVIARALSGDFELLRLPAIVLELAGGRQAAINDVAIHRKVGERVAELAYALGGEEAGSVRCDGLVVSTPAGSTGYNLANGGPVMAWGVEGLRRLLHRAALDVCARARGRAGRPADGLQPLARAVGPGCRWAPGRRDRRRRVDRGALPERRRHARAAAGVLVLPAPAREVRAPRQLKPAVRVQATRASAEPPSVVLALFPSCSIELTNASSWAREKRRWPPGVR